MKILLRKAILGALCLTMAGCFFSKHNNAEIEMPHSYAIGKVEVVDKTTYHSGGGVIVIPFIAGDGVPANNHVNRAGLMIVKGVADGLKGSDHYIFLTSDDANLSDVIIEGVIQQWGIDSGVAQLGVEVRMVDRYTDDLIMKVNIAKEKQVSDDVFDRIAHEIGQDIALHLTLSQREVK